MKNTDICPSCRKAFVPENGFFCTKQGTLICEPCYEKPDPDDDPCREEERMALEQLIQEKEYELEDLKLKLIAL